MDFFHQSDGSRTNSDISEDEDEHLSGALSEREEDILLRDGLLHNHLPRKNDWTFQSFSKRGSEYVGNLKSKIDPNLDSFQIAYNSFVTILLNKAKPKIQQVLSLVR